MQQNLWNSRSGNIALLMALAVFVALAIRSAPAHHDLSSDRPPSRVKMSDADIHQAVKKLESGHRKEQLQAVERLARYFGRAVAPDWQTRYHYSHKPTKRAQAVMAKPRPVSLLIECLKQKEPLVRLWALQKLRQQKLLSNTDEQKESTISNLLAIKGLITLTNKQKIADAMKPLLKDPDEHVRAGALYTATLFLPHSTYGLSRSSLEDSSPIVRRMAWGLVSRYQSSHSPPDAYILKHLKKALADKSSGVVRAALGFVETSGWQVRRYRKIGEPKQAKVWQKVLDACEPLVLEALKNRPKVKGPAVRACQFYPNSERLLIKALTDESVRFYAISSLWYVGKKPALEALKKMMKDSAAESQPSSLKSTIRAIEERLARKNGR